MDQVIAADRRQAAISRVHDDTELRVRQLQAGRKRNRASMRGVKGIQLHVSGDASRASDAGNQRNRLQVDFRFDERSSEAVHGGADAASRTPDMRHAIGAQEGLDRIGNVKNAHRLASTITFRMSSGRWTLPPACGTANVLAFPLAARSTSRTIWPRLSSGTTNAFVVAASSRMRFSGNGQHVISRSLPTLRPRSRAISM